MSGGPVSLRERLKQYQGLKENTQQTTHAPPKLQQELDFIAKKSPLRMSLRKFEGEGLVLPKSPDLDDKAASPGAQQTGKHHL
jgi:hypothetical protein